MKLALAQINYRIGDIEGNTEAIIKRIEQAKEAKADIVVFSELSVSGYPPSDFLTYPGFIENCNNAIKKIVSSCTNIAAIVGCPTINKTNIGKHLFNSAIFMADGEIKQIVHKSLLPDYDIFEENRYFEANTDFKIVHYKGKKIALTICEDLWNLSDKPLYKHSPMDFLIKENPEFMINIAASPFNYSKAEKRKSVLRANCLKYSLPLFYVNQVGGNTSLIFDGGSMAIDSKGRISDELKYFDEDFRIIATDEMSDGVLQSESSSIERIHHALVCGLRDYFHKLGFKKAILGLSGGLDSALVAAIAVEALGKENVTGLLMPSEYSSEHSVSDALKLAENLGCKYEKIHISDMFNSSLASLSPWFKNLEHDVTEENIQARIRGLILMAFSNKFGHVLLNTSNKSEAAVGYSTLYGDMCGGLSVIGDVYKTQAFELAAYINREREIIPINTIIKPPSAELRPDQKDSDSLPEYDILDPILMLFIEKGMGAEEIVREGHDKTLVDRILRLINGSEHKRFQSPPILRVSPKAFGSGRRMPLAANFSEL